MMILDILDQKGFSYDIAIESSFVIVPESFYYAIFFLEWHRRHLRLWRKMTPPWGGNGC